MPFSRYQIRNEFSLADPELYKSTDKDDPEALLEGVAMAGLVGILRQLGDLAEFAAEIFHGLHEEVMVTAARGHGLLVRVQQVESDFPSIERAFLSQTGHSAFFSSSGISWHPNLQTEQNLITKGDLPRFVMDSYEESRGPPRLFLLDKFDVAGAGACLKRYTDPSFYKVEASSYEMMSAEAQRDKTIRKTKKKGSRLKNGETPDVFQPSHVKLHQLLIEERVQNGASEPARRVKLKKREIKFPFDTENGKGYMEKLLSSPPEDKLVHEVPVGYSDLEPLGGTMVNSPMQNGSPYESPTVDKTVSREHMDHLENSSIELQADDIEDKHISVDVEQKEVGFEDGYRSDDVPSETENYMDALTTMKSEVETGVELRVANSAPIVTQEIEQIQSQFSDSQSASDDESSPIMNKITTFSYSDTSSTSPENISPHGINSQAFASTEIPFRPRVSLNEVSDNCIEVSDNESLPVDNGAIFKESTSKESDLSEMLSNNGVDVNSPTRKEEIEIDPEDIIYSTVYNEDDNSNSALVISDDVLESKSEPAESNVSYSSEDETELKDRETVSFGSQESTTADDEKELKEREPESVNSEAKDLIPVSVPDDVDSSGIQDLSTCEDIESKGREIETVDLEKNEDNGVSTTEEPGENGSVMNESGAGLSSSEFVEKESSDNPNSQNLDSIFNSFLVTEDDLNENDVDNLSAEKEAIESCENKESSELLVVSPELDSIPSASYDYLKIQAIDVNENDVENSSADLKILQDETLSVIEKTDQSGLQVDVSPDVDFQPVNHVLIGQSNAQFLENAPDSRVSADVQEFKSSKFNDQHFETKSQNQVDQIDKLETRVDQLKTVYSQNHLVDTHSDSDLIDHESYSLDRGENFHDHEEPSMAYLSQSSRHINRSGFNMLPQLAPRNIEEMQPLPPLPPMQWRMGKLQNDSLFSNPGGSQHDIIHQFPPASPDLNENATNVKSEHDFKDLSSEEDGNLVESLPGDGQLGIHQFPLASQDQNESTTDDKSEHDYEDLNTEEDGKLDVPMEMNAVKLEEKIVPQPPHYREQSENVSTSGREIIRPLSTSSLPPIDNEKPNGIRPMKIQRPRTPLIDAVAAHDKSKLKKASERAMPPVPKEVERDGLLEQIRAKSVNLKPAVQTRPSIQRPSTNLRVAAILEKANAIRQAFAGSDDDDDDNDSWSDS